MRCQQLKVFFVALLLAGGAGALPNALRIVSVQATAPGHTPVKPISIVVTVTNESQLSVSRPTVRLTLTPNSRRIGPRPYKPGGKESDPHDPTAFDPVVLEKEIDVLYPGRSRTLTFETPYLSSSGFITSRGNFEVENLVPNMRRSVVITYQVEVQL